MTKYSGPWSPGSFTKNFSWGPPSSGLLQLHSVIRSGFSSGMEDVPRSVFRKRVAAAGRPDFVPLNFFLFNRQVNGVDYVVADELVFQALSFPHSPRFDKLALFCFNLSFSGIWKGSTESQRRPAMWAHAYIVDVVDGRFGWNANDVSADSIEGFIWDSGRYTGKTTRKLATNLAYLYKVGRLREVPSSKIERWWVDALFLALDRIIEDRALDRRITHPADYSALLVEEDFFALTGRTRLDKELAMRHLVALYAICGGRDRFSESAVRQRAAEFPDIDYFLANDRRPRGALHPTNPQILKSIPSACAMLARYIGFEDIDPESLERFDVESFVREFTKRALHTLKQRNIRPTMSADEILKITREK